MGRPKPLLPWRGTTLVEHQIDALFKGGVSEVVVVVGHEADAVAAQVSCTGARCVVNPDYLRGEDDLHQGGLRAISPDADAILLLAVDQPRTASIVSAVVQAHVSGDYLITSPRYEGHGGHPLVFAAALRDELAAISECEEENQGIREVFLAHRVSVQEYVLDDPMIRLDLNTPEAYEEAVRRYGGEVSDMDGQDR